MAFVVKKYPEKSWSISKMKVIEGCYREYYYTYYGSHNGWLKDASLEAKLSWRLKKLSNIWLIFGDKLHIVISKILKSNSKDIKTSELVNYMRKTLNNVVFESKEKYESGSWDEYPKGEMLQEYYYNGKLNSKDILEIKRRIEDCSKNFLLCKTYKDLLRDDCKLLEADEGKFEYIFIHGIKVFTLIDSLYIDKDGYYVIVDWKTGQPSEYDKEQLLIYSIYVMERYGVSLDKIKGRLEYLLNGEGIEYEFSLEEIEEIKNRVKKDLLVIDNFLQDPINNEPKSKVFFRKCDNYKKCNSCKYKKLCYELEAIL